MLKQQKQVIEFQIAAFQQDPSVTDPFRQVSPHMLSESAAEQRCNMVGEEVHELVDAMYYDSVEDVAKELADIIYVVLGTASIMGINMEAVFQAVHEHNMLKLDSKELAFRAGKLLKPADMPPIDLSAALRQPIFVPLEGIK
jgi:predicted HAD superfamily Cof-like phosphohydrolase